MKKIKELHFEVSLDERDQEDHSCFHDEGIIPDVKGAIIDCSGHVCIIKIYKGPKIDISV